MANDRLMLDSGAVQNNYSYLTDFKIRNQVDSSAEAFEARYGSPLTAAEKQLLGALYYSIEVDLLDLSGKEDWVLGILNGSPDVMTAFSKADPTALAQAMFAAFSIGVAGRAEEATAAEIAAMLDQKAQMVATATGSPYLLTVAETPLTGQTPVTTEPGTTTPGTSTGTGTTPVVAPKKGLSTGAMVGIGALFLALGAGGVYVYDKQKKASQIRGWRSEWDDSNDNLLSF